MPICDLPNKFKKRVGEVLWKEFISEKIKPRLRLRPALVSCSRRSDKHRIPCGENLLCLKCNRLIDTHSAGQKSNYHLPGGRVLWLRISVTCSSVKISRSGDLRPSTFRTDARLVSTTRQPMAVRYSLLIRVRSFPTCFETGRYRPSCLRCFESPAHRGRAILKCHSGRRYFHAMS